jgi:hypothetical protein
MPNKNMKIAWTLFIIQTYSKSRDALYLCYAYTDGIDFTLKEYQENKNN